MFAYKLFLSSICITFIVMPGPGCHGITLHRGADRYPSHYLYSMESLDTKDTLSLEERREFLHLAASLAEKMRELVIEVAPELFRDAGPGCLRGGCPEGKMTCGKAAEMRKKYLKEE